MIVLVATTQLIHYINKNVKQFTRLLVKIWVLSNEYKPKKDSENMLDILV